MLSEGLPHNVPVVVVVASISKAMAHMTPIQGTFRVPVTLVEPPGSSLRKLSPFKKKERRISCPSY